MTASHKYKKLKTTNQLHVFIRAMVAAKAEMQEAVIAAEVVEETEAVAIAVTAENSKRTHARIVPNTFFFTNEKIRIWKMYKTLNNKKNKYKNRKGERVVESGCIN